MTAETDAFIVATFALWAGDFDYAERLLNQFSPPHKTASLDSSEIQSPEDLIRRTGALRLRQLWQKKGEFKVLIAADPSIKSFASEPMVLSTDNLRGAVWRLNSREFQMLAYLTRLDWETQMIRLAHLQAGRHESFPRPHDKQTRDLFAELNHVDVQQLGTAWNVTGDLLLQVNLSDMCLLEVRATWTAVRLPDNVQEIVTPLLNLLKSLDPEHKAIPDSKVSELTE